MLEHFSWIDIFFIILLLGMVYKGSQMGVGAQMLSLAGYLFLLYVSAGYYLLISEAIFGFLLQSWAKPFSFFILSITGLFFIKLIQRLFSMTGQEEMAVIERAGGMLVAFLRAGILIGLISMTLLLVPSERINSFIADSSALSRYSVEMNLGLYSRMRQVSGADLPDIETQRDMFFENK